MDPTEQDVQERHFIEQMGLLCEETGASRMLGRILGFLLICEVEHQSSAEIAEFLGASRGTVSTITRQLLQMGMIEKVPVPNSRATYFRMRIDGWADLMRRQMAYLRLTRETADAGLDLLSGAPPERRQRLRSFRDFYAHMERELHTIIDHWGAAHPEEDG